MDGTHGPEWSQDMAAVPPGTGVVVECGDGSLHPFMDGWMLGGPGMPFSMPKRWRHVSEDRDDVVALHARFSQERS